MAGMKPIGQVTASAAQATSWPVFLRGFCQVSLRDAEGCVSAVILSRLAAAAASEGIFLA